MRPERNLLVFHAVDIFFLHISLFACAFEVGWPVVVCFVPPCGVLLVCDPLGDYCATSTRNRVRVGELLVHIALAATLHCCGSYCALNSPELSRTLTCHAVLSGTSFPVALQAL